MDRFSWANPSSLSFWRNRLAYLQSTVPAGLRSGRLKGQDATAAKDALRMVRGLVGRLEAAA